MRTALVTVGVAVVLGAAAGASAEVQLTIHGGRVTLVAKDVTVRQILAEWARVGQTTIVNAERIPGGPVTLELIDVPEQHALEVLLRSASGYLAAPRTTATAANASVFDRILVMPTSVPPPASAASQPPPAFAQPSFPPPFPPVADDDRDEAGVAAGVTGGPTPNRGPVFTFPPPQVTGPQQVPAPAQPFQPPQVVPQTGAPATFPPAVSYPGAPTATAPPGVAVPGMLVPTPAPQPGQPVVVFPGQPPAQPQR